MIVMPVANVASFLFSILWKSLNHFLGNYLRRDTFLHIGKNFLDHVIESHVWHVKG